MHLRIKNWLRGHWFLDGVKQDGCVPHKWFSGEEVSMDGAIISGRRKPGWTCVGIVDYLNRTGYGFSPRGVPMYMCHPLDASLPPFIVASKEKPATNMIVVVGFEHWNDKWPRGGIQRVLGPVGDPDVELDALRLRTLVTDSSASESVIPSAPLIDLPVEKWDTVFNIDPVGCEDVDDILGWRSVGEGRTEFMIGIAYVAAWIKADSSLDMTARRKAQTVYSDGAVLDPMLPTAISAGCASLRCDGVARPVLAQIYTLEHGMVISQTWRRFCVGVGTVYSYESVLADEGVCEKIKEYLEAVRGCSVGEDPHVWIEHAMIQYNSLAGAVLHTSGYGMLRAHAGRVSAEDYAALATASGCGDIAHLGFAAGEYVPSSSADTKHAGLGLNCYAHASSPLRRYADLHNQRCLVELLFADAAEKPLASAAAHLCDGLNSRAAVIKAFERDVWFLKNLNTGALTEAEGIVLKQYDKRPDQWAVYVPIWKRKIRGVCTTGIVLTPGLKVVVRAYCDLRRPSWDNRVVCSLSIS